MTDATADVPPAERNAVRGVPWIVLPELWRTEHDFELRDDGDVSRELIEAVLTAGPDPIPTEPDREDFASIYGQLREIDRVFSIHSPSSVSKAIDNAREAASSFPNVRVIEASVTGIGVGLLATLTRNLAATDASLDEVEAWLQRHRTSVRMLVVPDRFDPTATQRRLTSTLLTGRPMLQGGGASGRMDRSRGLRSRRATVAAIEKFFIEHTTSTGDLHLALGHGDAAGAIDPFLDVLERIHPDAQIDMVGRVGPRLLQQLGSRCVAAAWLETSSAPATPA